MPTCLHPTMVKGKLFPCGKCPNCTQNKRNALTARFLLEAGFCGGPTYFVTLTYAQDHIPTYNGINCFCKKDIQNLIKSLRHEFRFKYFATSEFGSRTCRSHYHMLFFMQHPIPMFEFRNRLEHFWSKGYIQISIANNDRFGYVSKYTLKSDPEEFRKLPNGHPLKPFRLFSLKPGIGSSAINFLNEYIYNEGNFRTFVEVNGQRIVLDQFFMRHLDPSLVAEIKHRNYDLNYKEIQESLAKPFRNNVRKVKNEALDPDKIYFWKNGEPYEKDYTKDNEIRKRRNNITNLKKHQL